VLHTIDSAAKWTGGPSESVTGLCRALDARGIRVTLLAQEGPDTDVIGSSGVRIEVAGPRGLAGARAFARRAQELLAAERFDVVHDHGIWRPSNHLVARAARRAGVPRVVSPRGMLDPWAMRWHRARKALAWAAWQRRDVKRCHALHATSEAEAEGIRRLDLGVGVFVVPNGVDLDALRVVSLPVHPPHVCLFLSRIHPKKGLIDLLEAWARVRPRDWLLRIRGPDEGGHRREVEQRVTQLALSDVVEVGGALEGPEKQRALGEASTIVLPSLSENFGIIVAEGLATGRPVMTTRATPWDALETEACGWWVEPGVDSLEKGLRRMASTSPEAREAMGQRGRAFVARTLAWPAVAREMALAYESVLGAAAAAGRSG
jgi:glycosyltransferase involved in cell wall biosynthesis